MQRQAGNGWHSERVSKSDSWRAAPKALARFVGRRLPLNNENENEMEVQPKGSELRWTMPVPNWSVLE